MKERCLAIPAIKKNAIIPDQLVKKLAGVTLIERALDIARACAPGRDIVTLTDSEEIGLICQRAGVRFERNPQLRFKTFDIVSEMRDFLARLAEDYNNCIILRPSCPLLTWVDVEDAWKEYRKSGAASLITVKRVRQRLWRGSMDSLESVLVAASEENGPQQEFLVESRALIILNLDFLRHCGSSRPARVIPWFLGDRGLEIESYQDWWICERLLERRHVVFVVAGFPAIGMGHIYRALMLAHAISSHKITFVCTLESDLAVEKIASRDYHVVRQGSENLSETVLNLHPDLVVNDFLDTSRDYMSQLADSGARTVNFEDEGPGSELADLVINALYEGCPASGRVRCGPKYFCLRDEFERAHRNPLRPQVYTLLITFGGTDQFNFTGRTLGIVEPVCRAFGIAIRVVAGPGYAHKAELEQYILALDNPLVTFSWATNIMSQMMEGADLAICSAGRTVYELAHMRVPGIVIATHEREARHGFGRPANGFVFAGLMGQVSDQRIRNVFLAMLKQKRRAKYWERQNRLSFYGNKERVIGLMQDQLEKEQPDVSQTP